jgi:predicted molibdopterin-dependent oxidoreductase YjgC
MFRRLSDLTEEKAIAFSFDGRPLLGRDGDTIAAALLANGIERFRSHPVSGEARSAYCLMGVCFECLVTVDGVGNRQACMTLLGENMVVETQHGARDVRDGDVI